MTTHSSNDLSSDFLGDVLGFTEHAERAFFELYRSRTKKRTAIHINYGDAQTGTMVIGPIAGSSYEYCFVVVLRPKI